MKRSKKITIGIIIFFLVIALVVIGRYGAGLYFKKKFSKRPPPGVIVEIVTPGTGDPVEEGEIGEVLVTSLNPDYPLIRFATGDLSAVAPGKSECGRTNMRIVGWRGRADQTTKIKGMFVRPEQVADLVGRSSEIKKARVNVTRSDNNDIMTVLLEIEGDMNKDYSPMVKEILKLKGDVELVTPGSLPNDGKVIDDQRTFD